MLNLGVLVCYSTATQLQGFFHIHQGLGDMSAHHKHNQSAPEAAQTSHQFGRSIAPPAGAPITAHLEEHTTVISHLCRVPDRVTHRQILLTPPQANSRPFPHRTDGIPEIQYLHYTLLQCFPRAAQQWAVTAVAMVITAARRSQPVTRTGA